MNVTLCPECGHDLEITHGRTGCDQFGCDCKRNSRGKLPGARGKKRADDLRSRLEGLTERGRAHGPTLREVTDEAEGLREYLQQALDALDELGSAADDYENAEEGKEGADDRLDAWEVAQEQAEYLRTALDEIVDQLTEGT